MAPSSCLPKQLGSMADLWASIEAWDNAMAQWVGRDRNGPHDTNARHPNAVANSVVGWQFRTIAMMVGGLASETGADSRASGERLVGRADMKLQRGDSGGYDPQ
jgi:hypothetical protein